MTDPTPSKSNSKSKMSPLSIVLLLSASFFVIFLIFSAIFLFNKKSQPKSALFRGGGSVGVVELNGVIMDSKKVLKRLEKFEDDESIKAVVMRLNSPGGAVAPSQEIYQAVKRYKKPLVVSMGSVAASGAYYIACGSKKVYANPGTITGSIGVIMEFVNLQKLYEWAKVDRFSIKTGKFKDAGAEYRPMTPEERSLLQGMIDDVLVQFKQAVAEGRKLSREQVNLIADGRIFSGAQAKDRKMVDELGTLQDAIDDVAKQAGIKGKPDVVYPEKPRRGIWDFFIDSRGGGEEDAESSVTLLSALLNALLGVSASGSAQEATSVSAPGVYWLWKAAR